MDCKSLRKILDELTTIEKDLQIVKAMISAINQRLLEHGIPRLQIDNYAERELKQKINEYLIKAFNEKCLEWVDKQ